MYWSLVIRMDTILYESESEIAQPWTVAYEAPPSMEFSRQEYWSGLPFPSSEDLPYPGIEPRSPALQADSFTIWAMREAHTILYSIILFQTRWLFTFPSIDLHGLLNSCLLLT